MENLKNAVKLEDIKNLVKDDEYLGNVDDETLNNSLDMLNTLSPEDLEKYQEYQKQVLSMGVPACKIMMTILLHNALTDDADIKYKFFEMFENALTVEKFGGLSVEYFDTDQGKNTYCYIILNKCHKSHNLSEQFEKIHKFMTAEQWDHVLKQISMLLYITKNIYKLSISSFSEHIFNLGFDINDIEVLNVDPSNTTLYINEEWDERTGIYIMRESELEELAAANASDTATEEPLNNAAEEALNTTTEEALNTAAEEALNTTAEEALNTTAGDALNTAAKEALNTATEEL
jgi:hypothetical protein